LFAIETGYAWFHRFARYAFYVGLLAVTALSVIPITAAPSMGVSDKIGHFLAYLALGTAGVLGFSGMKRPLAVVLAIIAFGFVLECIQLFVPGRMFSGLDMIANVTGAVVGAGLSGVVGIFRFSRS
jgi:VanZ family protein